MKHDELQESLASHLRGGSDRMVWTNTQLGPSASPRPDVFSVATSFARFRADAYEIKVSLSDLRRDVTSGKWQSYRKFAHAVWFAFPSGLAPLELIPLECGVILLGKTWRAARKPVAQTLDTLPRDAWLKLLMCGGPERGREPAPRTMNTWKQEEFVRSKFGDELGALFGNLREAERTLRYRTELLAGEAAAIEEKIAATRARVLEAEKKERTRLDDAMKRLAMQLGVPEDATADDLAAAVGTLRYKLQQLANVDNLIDQLRTVAGLVKSEAQL